MKNIPFPFFTILILLIACKTVIDIQIPVEPPKLVINSTLISNEYFKVHLSQSQHILDMNDYKTVSGATVKIFEDETLLTTLPDSTDGNYISAVYKPQKGKTYSIIVSKDGFENASAKVTLPAKSANIKSIVLDTVEFSEFDYFSKYLRFDIELEDDVDIENFYEITVFETSWHFEYDSTIVPPLLIDSALLTTKLFLESKDLGLEEFQSYGDHILFNDNLFNGKTYNIKVMSAIDTDNNERDSRPTYKVKVGNTSESYYLYEISFQLQKWTEFDPLSEPAQVYNNITEGYGIFGASIYKTIPLE